MTAYDLAVIGAGIVGTTAAYLAGRSRPDWRILLVDRSLIGSGATGYSAGLDSGYGATDDRRRLARASRRLYRQLKADLPELPIRRLPLYTVVSRARMTEVVAGHVDGGVRPATAAEELRLRRAYPDLRVSDEQVLLTGSSASYAPPGLVASALAGGFKQGRLAQCWEGVDIEAVRAREGGLALATADGRTVLARSAIVATGPWLSDGPGRAAAHAARVRVKKVVALHIARAPRPEDPVLLFRDVDAFLLPLPDRGEWLFSFPCDEWVGTPDRSSLRITAEDRALALSILERYCPSLVPECHGGRVFCDAYTDDRRPLVSPAPGMANVVVVGAGSGSGFRLAPGLAQEALRRLPLFADGAEPVLASSATVAVAP